METKGWGIPPLALAIALAAIGPAAARGAPDAKSIFRKRCTACHTYGKGVKVGPDLKGVTQRRSRPWLLSFIRSSSRLIEAGDSAAVRLFQQFKRERMPDWSDLSPEQVGGLLDYLAANGPEQKEPDERNALNATAAEVESGGRLFHGDVPLTYGGTACHTCHRAGHDDPLRDGALAPDLSRVYWRYRDGEFTNCLRDLRPVCRGGVRREPYLTPQEAFALKAYLAREAGLPLGSERPAYDLAKSELARGGR